MLLNYSGSEGNKYQGTVLKIVFLILITDSAFYSNSQVSNRRVVFCTAVCLGFPVKPSSRFFA